MRFLETTARTSGVGGPSWSAAEAPNEPNFSRINDVSIRSSIGLGSALMASKIPGHARPSRSAYSPLVLLCACLSAGIGLLGTFNIKTISGSLVARPSGSALSPEVTMTGPGSVVSMQHGISKLASSKAPRRIAFFGDSTAVSYPKRRTIPSRLQQQLAALSADTKREVRVQSLGMLGLSPYDFYFAAHETVGAEPDGVVIGFTLASMSDRFNDRFRRPAFAALLAPQQLLEASGLPIHRYGLTADKLLFYAMLGWAEVEDSWNWFASGQQRVQSARRDLIEAANQLVDPEATDRFEYAHNLHRMLTNNLPGQKRFNATGTKAFYAKLLDGLPGGDPALVMLRAAIETYTDAGIPTLVYIGPFNYQHVDELGLLDRGKLQLSILAVKEEIRASGARVVDLHDLIPDSGFRDAGEHLTVDGIDGPLEVAKRIAPEIEEMLDRKRTGD
jgi:hypothetical protein